VERKFERYLETGFETSSSSTSTYHHHHHHHHRQNGGDKNEKEDNDDDDENRVFLNQRVLDAIEKSVSFVDCDKDIFNNEKKLLVQKTTNKEALERGSKYTSSACLIIAGKLKKDREEVVAKVLKRLTEEQNEMKHFRVEARGGFLNFFPSSSEGNSEKTKIKPSRGMPTKKKEKKDDHPTLKPQKKKTTSKHKMFTVTVENSEFRREDFELWQRYQAKIHNDPPSKLKKSSYVNFLCDTPLVSDDKTYGSKHFRYFIDDKLVAVGVCDVLPTALSSVYFYHDPDLMKLELGKLSALYEIDFVSKNRNTAKYSLGDFKYYYMGYYIHDCQKMRYKGEYKPSELRCPTTGKWVSLDDEKTREKLDAHSFRLVSDDDDANDDKVSMKKEDKDEQELFGSQIVGVIQNGQYLGPTRLMGNGSPIYHMLNASNLGKRKLRMMKQFRRDVGGGENEFVYLVNITPSFSSSLDDSGKDDGDDEEEDELFVASPSSSSDGMSA
jgi:arginine-tRNA-protein transferase